MRSIYALVGLVLLTLSAVATDGTVKQTLPILNDPIYSGTNGGEFGYSMASNGEYLAGGTLSQKVVLYKNDGDTMNTVAVFEAADNGGFDGYGQHLSMHDTVLAVSSPQHDNSKGAVYVIHFDGTNWTARKKIMAPDGANNDRFGVHSVVHADTMLIGAPGADGGKGAVYQYLLNGTWNFDKKYTPTDAIAGDGFGSKVTYNNGKFAATSPAHPTGGGKVGCAYVFEDGGASMTQLAKVFPSDADFNENFGSCLGFSNRVLYVGASDKKRNDTTCGAVYQFIDLENNFEQATTIYADTIQEGARFGCSFAENGEYIAIGSRSRDGGEGAIHEGTRNGAVFHEQRMNKSKTNKTSWTSFGQSVAYHLGDLLGGANYGKQSGGTETGTIEFLRGCDPVNKTVTFDGEWLNSAETNAVKYVWFHMAVVSSVQLPSGEISVQREKTAVGAGMHHKPTETGVYYLVFTMADGCYFQTDNIDVQSITSVNNPNESNISFSPNPTNGPVSITSSDKVQSVVIRDVNGKVIETINAPTANLINIEGGAGVYFLTVITTGGQEVLKVVKE